LPSDLPVPLPSLPIDEILPTVTASPLPGQLNDTVKSLTALLGLDGGTNPTPGGGTGAGNGTTGTTGTTTDPTGTTELGGLAPLTGTSLSTGYAAIAGRAVSKAAGRALRLAGPFAPPLVLAGIVLLVLYMISNGSQRLVKIDTAAIARRSWRL